MGWVTGTSSRLRISHSTPWAPSLAASSSASKRVLTVATTTMSTAEAYRRAPTPLGPRTGVG